jgi:hypothetical protein
MKTRNKLKLYEIADRLESFRIDNGPNGEDAPFESEADELRTIARTEETLDEGGYSRSRSDISEFDPAPKSDRDGNFGFH